MLQVRINELGELKRESQKSMEQLLRETLPQFASTELPVPKKYPVSVTDFLLLVLPKKRKEDRMKIYREHLRIIMGPDGNSVVNQTDEEIDAMG